MTAARGFAIEHWSGTFIAEVGPRERLDEAGRAETERALSTLLFDYRHQDGGIARSIETLHQKLFAPGLLQRPPPGAGASSASPTVIERISRDLRTAARLGRLSIKLQQRSPTVARRRVEGLGAAALGPTAEAPTTFFEATFVDEVGQPIAGLDVVLTADGKPNQLTTDGSGKVRLDDIRDSFAALRVSNVQGLRDIVEPRWAAPRSGQMPSAPNLLQLPLTDDISGLSLESAVPQLIVIVPPLGKLFVELFDRDGRVRHAERAYSIEGPAKFSGK
ncbi:MAG TPA: Ig-like domain-containing protein, partial [Polyangiaceae bacterium]|nr:Ig-like domain-containing protein [Polyangiaceae bacterium]